MSRDRFASAKLKSLRIDAGMSPEQLGWIAGVSGHTVRRIERHGAIPTPRVQLLLAGHFEMRPTELWNLKRAGVAA
jgi:DNA-binding XRE family transcriptional regulator